MAPTSAPAAARPGASIAIICAIATDAGITGWGEMAPLGNFYSPAFAAGARAGFAEIAPHLIGQDPRGLSRHRPADGHGVQGPSLHQVGARHGLLGSCRARRRYAAGDAARRPRQRHGRALQGRSPMARSKPWPPLAKRIVAEGFRRLQVKVGGNVRRRHRARARGRRRGAEGHRDLLRRQCRLDPYQARQFADATRGIDYTFEQPCTSLDENAGAPRRSTSRWCSTNPSPRWRTCWRSIAAGWPTG